jgi:hypothetical protein
MTTTDYHRYVLSIRGNEHDPQIHLVCTDCVEDDGHTFLSIADQGTAVGLPSLNAAAEAHDRKTHQP